MIGENLNFESETQTFDVICLSHLRWDFVYQRPQHLMTRFAREGRVYYFEEPVYVDGETHLEVSERGQNVLVCVPFINHGEAAKDVEIRREMLNEIVRQYKIENFVLWFYTPMAMDFAAHLKPQATIFDCMDELSAFRFAPPALLENEEELLRRADLVFTGGQSLFEAKKNRHAKVFAFPSSIDTTHFAKARNAGAEPAEQSTIPHPKLGFAGVIDERMDTHLLAEMADLRPEWHFVLIGPTVKIAPEELPRRSNIHYLGGKKYDELPAYISGWDVALMPFAMNESTRFISPTKTPEYLAAGKCTVSAPIRDVINPYGEKGLVAIAATAEEFVAEAEKILERGNSDEWQAKVDEFLALNSWDKTFAEMKNLIAASIGENLKKDKQTGVSQAEQTCSNEQSATASRKISG